MLFIDVMNIILSCLSRDWWQKIMKLIVNAMLINHRRTPSPVVTMLGSAIFSLKTNSLWVKCTSHWRSSLDHCKNIESKFSGLKATCGTKCSETIAWQMSRFSSKQYVQQIGVIAKNTDSTSGEMVSLQNVDHLNCTKTVLFSSKNKNRMSINASRLLPEFNVYPSDVTFR